MGSETDPIASLTPDDAIVDWATDVPESIRVFEKFGVDYCCGGKSLDYACGQRGIEVQQIVDEIRIAAKNAVSEGASSKKP
ncbi:DUF542 domain-containing protein [Thalassoroseus pseudoceratinae]|uniref:DUF542 domain-containing protein n=1 Tax=Thalassoroseus pseudoceratinae TaxID=2713176 RepID=UPI0014238404|nr:DUF542 domain-containing protein [Thalassoroseus pseudoceratinae]